MTFNLDVLNEHTEKIFASGEYIYSLSIQCDPRIFSERSFFNQLCKFREDLTSWLTRLREIRVDYSYDVSAETKQELDALIKKVETKLNEVKDEIWKNPMKNNGTYTDHNCGMGNTYFGDDWK